MENTLKKLRPIEILFLFSKEKPEVYNKKNALHCIIYSLIENKNIEQVKNKFRVNITGTSPNKAYESEFIDLLKSQEYIKLNKFIEGLKVFNQTLVDYNIFENATTVKKFLFIPIAKTELKKTAMYFELQAHLNKQSKTGVQPLDIACENGESKDKVLNFYNFVKSKIKKAYADEEAEKAKNKKQGFSLGVKEE